MNIGLSAGANRAHAAGIWPPTRVSGLVGWWDMQQTFTQSGGLVSSIRNMASGVDWTEVTNKPAYSATGFGGRPCMVGDGATTRIMSSEAAVVSAFSGAAKSLTFIVACQPTATQSSALIGAADSALVANSSWKVGLTSNVLAFAKRGTATTTAPGATTLTNNASVVLAFRTNGTTADMLIGGGTVEAQAAAFVDSGTPVPNRVSLLCYPVLTPSSFFNGKWGAGTLYNVAVSNADLIGLVNGMRSQWGI